MEKQEEPGGRTYWILGGIEIWAPRLPIDTSDTPREVNGQIVSGKYLIGDEFVCFCMSADERNRWKETFPDAPEWLDNPPME